MDLSNSASPGWLAAVFQISQVGYLLVALVVGGRLLWLSRQTGGAPERLLGLQFVIGSGIAYPVLISGVMRGAPLVRAGELVEPQTACMIAFGHLGIDVAIVFMMLFVRTVFRANEAWAGRLVWAAMAYMAATYVGMGFAGQFTRPTLNGTAYWLHYMSTAWVMAWATFEAFRYHALMRRRMKVGLADAVVTNRFLLWGGASVCGLMIAVLAATPQLYSGFAPEIVAMFSAAVLTAMSLFGVAAVALYWMTFFPTQGYLRWVERSYASA